MSRRDFMAFAPAAAALAHLGRPTPGKDDKDNDDPLGVRNDFPLARTETHLNAAYIALIPKAVEDAGVRFVRSKANGPISLPDMQAKTDEARVKFARLMGADKEEIGFLFATSEGENLIARALDLKPGDNVVIDELHYDTTFVLYKHLEKTAGIELRIAKASGGAAPPTAFEPLVDDRTRLVSVAWVSHQNGFRHDMKALAELAHAHGAYLYTDAIQAAGMFPMNLHEVGVDFLTSGTYKWLLASYGVAPFYIRRELLDAFPHDRLGALHIEKNLGEHRYRLYETARKYEYATLAFGAVFQLDAALDYLARVGTDRIETHTVGLAHKLQSGLADIGFRLSTPPNNGSSIVSFYSEKDQQEVRHILDSEKIRVSLREQGTQIRVGIALYNNGSDIDHFLEVAKKFA